ncbi:MAG: UTRA domain-containing protein, partial [Agrobacterium sp.]|nr:UTRA domain-containing protein [Agrobacterium sp.]
MPARETTGGNRDIEAGRRGGLEQQLRRAIAAGDVVKDGRLFSERQLIAKYATTRITLREALFHLEIDGLIFRESRRGWFVSGPRLVYSPLHRSHFHRMAAEQGRSAETLLVEAEATALPEELAPLMRCAPGTPFWRIRRKRSIDGRLVLFVEHYLSMEIFPDIVQHDLTRSLTTIYQDSYAVTYGPAYFEINPVALRGYPAHHLGCSEGAYG